MQDYRFYFWKFTKTFLHIFFWSVLEPSLITYYMKNETRADQRSVSDRRLAGTNTCMYVHYLISDYIPNCILGGVITDLR